MDRPAIPKTLGKKKKSEGTSIESTTTSILNSPSSTIDFESTANSSILNSTVSLEKPIKNSFAWNDIKEKNRIIKLYTCCPSNKLFMFIVDHVRPKTAVFQTISNLEPLKHQGHCPICYFQSCFGAPLYRGSNNFSNNPR